MVATTTEQVSTSEAFVEKSVVYNSKLTALAATTVGARANRRSSKAWNC